jgi:hypothetical protein
VTSLSYFIPIECFSVSQDNISHYAVLSPSARLGISDSAKDLVFCCEAHSSLNNDVLTLRVRFRRASGAKNDAHPYVIASSAGAKQSPQWQVCFVACSSQ